MAFLTAASWLSWVTSVFIHLLQADLDDAAAQHGDQVLDRVQGDDLALVDDGDPVAEQLDLFHVVAGVDDAHAALAVQLEHAFEDVVAALRIDAYGGLIQEEQLRLVHQSSGDVHAALHPAGEFLDRVVLAVGQRNDLQHIIDPLFELLAAQAVQAAEEIQVGAGAEGGVERQVLRHQPDQVFDLDGIFADIDAADARRARRWFQDPGQHRDGGGLPGPVRSQQTKDFSCFNAETHPFYGREFAKFLNQVFNFQNIGHCSFLLSEQQY